MRVWYLIDIKMIGRVEDCTKNILGIFFISFRMHISRQGPARDDKLHFRRISRLPVEAYSFRSAADALLFVSRIGISWNRRAKCKVRWSFDHGTVAKGMEQVSRESSQLALFFRAIKCFRNQMSVTTRVLPSLPSLFNAKSSASEIKSPALGYFPSHDVINVIAACFMCRGTREDERFLELDTYQAHILIRCSVQATCHIPNHGV